MPHFETVTQDVIDLAKEIIEAHHPVLQSAKIGFVFVDKAPRVGGKEVWGTISKTSPKVRTVMGHRAVDFIVTLSKPEYQRLENQHQRALIDHELCHAYLGDNGWTLRGHDVEEFYEIIQRYGLWNYGLRLMASAVQPHLVGFEVDLPTERGSVVALGEEVELALEEAEER